ncbi:MAG: hypothetical protein IPP48_06000 [Chitinophagaceae bacterium]|nr:hypothetical protein [Chitinophagaceae bacterium]
MKKLSNEKMKQILGGNAVASCSIKCIDKQFHSVDCGTNACETTAQNTVNCTNGNDIVSTSDPCKDVTEPAEA